MRKNRRDGSANAISIMKYAVSLLLVVFIVLLMLFTGTGNNQFEDVKKTVDGALDKEELVEQPGSVMRRNFGLNAADYNGAVYYWSESNVSAAEVLLIRVRSTEQIREVTEAVESRVSSRKKVFEGYDGDQVQLLDDHVLSVRGTYVFYAVSPDAADYLSAFNGSI